MMLMTYFRNTHFHSLQQAPPEYCKVIFSVVHFFLYSSAPETNSFLQKNAVAVERLYIKLIYFIEIPKKRCVGKVSCQRSRKWCGHRLKLYFQQSVYYSNSFLLANENDCIYMSFHNLHVSEGDKKTLVLTVPVHWLLLTKGKQPLLSKTELRLSSGSVQA